MRYLVEKLYGYNASGVALYYAEIAGDSSVAKPTKSSNGDGLLVGGSLFFETDTGKNYILDEATGDWVDYPA